MPQVNRNVVVVTTVLGFHALIIWALQVGLLHRAVELVVPIEMLSEIIEPPRPVEPPKPINTPPVVTPRPEPKRTLPAPPPQLVVQAPNPEPAPTAPTAVIAPPQPLPPIAAPVRVAAPPPAPAPPAPAPPAPRVELPSADADYLQNPKPGYPRISKSLREEGTVRLRVLIGIDGLPKTVEMQESSGFFRLDQSAMDTVRQWKFVPGKRAGVPEAMWYTIPVVFKVTS